MNVVSISFIWMCVPLHVSLMLSRHSAICHLWVCTTKMLKGIWQTGQKSSDGSSLAALLSLCVESFVWDAFKGTLCDFELILVSTLPVVVRFLLSAALLFVLDLTETEVCFLVFLEVLLLLVPDGESFLFLFFWSGLYSQMSFSESSFCDMIWTRESNANLPLLHKN